MNHLLCSVRAVLWGLIGLGGRQADARSRVDAAGALPTLIVALVFVVLLVLGLIAVARFVAAS